LSFPVLGLTGVIKDRLKSRQRKGRGRTIWLWIK
jgi:hypothetical protein